MLSQSEINKRLHLFNLTNDWSVFNDVPAEQAVSVMYPHVLVVCGVGETAADHAARRKEILNRLFGPLA